MTATARPSIDRPVEPSSRRGLGSLSTPGLGVDMVLAGAMMALATVVRWPYLWLVPRFTDETLEVLHSLAVIRDGARPLTNYDSYYGALYTYLVAAALLLGGESPLAPRVVVLVAAVLTVGVTYGLGYALARRVLPVDVGTARLCGVMAAGVLAVNGPHVVVNSHVAWSNCLTPLFVTAALWALVPGEGTSRWALPLAGLLLGLALQTHPLVVVLLPGVVVGVLWRRWSLLRTPWPWIAAGCFLLGYANMLAFNVETGFESIRGAERMRVEYAQDQQASAGYVASLATMTLLLARILGGAADHRGGWTEYLLDAAVIAMSALAVVGIWLAARRGLVLPLAVSASFLLLLPVANSKFSTLITSRYVMPLTPLLVSCASIALVAGVHAAIRKWPARRPAIWMVSAIVGVILIVLPLLALGRYYERTLSRSDTNERILRLTAEIQAARQLDEPVLIDDGIGSELPDTGVTELRGFEYLLAFARVPHRAIRPSPGRLQDEVDRVPSVLAVLNARDAANAGGRVRVEPLDDRPPAETGRMSDFRLYRLSRVRA